jgi:hypothetical protein
MYARVKRSTTPMTWWQEWNSQPAAFVQQQNVGLQLSILVEWNKYPSYFKTKESEGIIRSLHYSLASPPGHGVDAFGFDEESAVSIIGLESAYKSVRKETKALPAKIDDQNSLP